MNDPRVQFDNEYFSLIESFLRNQVDADAFVSDYFEIWYRERNFDDDVRRSWARRFDLELWEQLNNNVISKEEFSDRWAALFGLTGARAALEEMKGRIFAACDVYSPEPKNKFEIDAKALWDEVAAHYRKVRGAV